MQRGARVGTIVFRIGTARGGEGFSFSPLLLSFGRVAHGSDAERSWRGGVAAGGKRTGLKPEQLQHESPFAPFSPVTRGKRTPDASSPQPPRGSDPQPLVSPFLPPFSEGFCPLCSSVSKVRRDSLQLLSPLRGGKKLKVSGGTSCSHRGDSSLEM